VSQYRNQSNQGQSWTGTASAVFVGSLAAMIVAFLIGRAWVEYKIDEAERRFQDRVKTIKVG
jgi:membrane protein DedA with SNARE-associated domain